jgi:acyl-coenzyme A synthetase/AMP-(fatty) acid ligase
MLQNNWASLWDRLTALGHPSGRFLWGADASVALGDLAHGSSLSAGLEELCGRSVLVATRDQLTAALALIELDGIARRLVLCAPDLPVAHVPSVMATAGADAILSDRGAAEIGVPSAECLVPCSPRVAPGYPERSARYQTEWILLTSGTTGLPKLVLHNLSTLAGAIKSASKLESPDVWSTFYDIRRYGGLQIFLRALLGGGSLVLSSAEESTADFLTRAGGCGVTHISGTPSHWRRALMSPSARRLSPRYIRLSGEIADQTILDTLGTFYPETTVAHAFASTEAGVVFDVVDGLAGFPASFIGNGDPDVEMKVEVGSLWIRSKRTAIRYLGSPDQVLVDNDGFVDTGDMLELRHDRYYFVGRRDGIINVGGLKVHPEEVEAVINSLPSVRMSRVKARKSPITGAIVVADVVVRVEADLDGASPATKALEIEILEACRRALAPHKVPAAIRFVPSLDIGVSGKLTRL